jgi:hypothetical protein
MLWTIGAVFVVSMDDGFGVAVGVELVTEFLELLSQFEIVVDLAVVDDPGGSILIVNWLMTAGDVDDGKTAHPEPGRAIEIETIVVWATMTDGGAHARQERLIDCVTVATNYSDYATHLRISKESWDLRNRSILTNQREPVQKGNRKHFDRISGFHD